MFRRLPALCQRLAARRLLSSTSKPPPKPELSVQPGSSHSKVAAAYVREAVKELDTAMNYKGFHTLRWTAGLVGFSGLSLYVFRDEITDWFGTTGADITSRTLGDKSVQREARELARGFVYELLNDRRALALTTEFLNNLLGRDYTRAAVLDLLANVIVQDQTKLLFAELLKNVMSDPQVIQNVSVFIQQIAEREQTKDAMVRLFAAIFADPAAQESMATFFKHVMATPTFTDAADNMTAQTVHNLLDNREVKKHAIGWTKSVLGEPDLHSHAGDAIWGAIRSTFIPGFLGGGKPKPILKSFPSLPPPSTFDGETQNTDIATATDYPTSSTELEESPNVELVVPSDDVEQVSSPPVTESEVDPVDTKLDENPHPTEDVAPLEQVNTTDDDVEPSENETDMAESAEPVAGNVIVSTEEPPPAVEQPVPPAPADTFGSAAEDEAEPAPEPVAEAVVSEEEPQAKHDDEQTGEQASVEAES